MGAFSIIDPGPFATIQDLGRHGYKRSGVSVSGAMDECAFRIANMLVGNDENEAAIEFTISGGTYAVDAASCRIAIAGGDFPLTINGSPAAAYATHTVADGAQLVIGRAQAGTRGYLAVAGGFDLPEVLSSRSTHVRSGLGGTDGGVLTAGSNLPLRAEKASEGPDCWLPHDLWPAGDGVVRVVMGPQDDYFTQNGIQTFLSGQYRITEKSDRMGYRLDGMPVEHLSDYNIVSDGIVRGSVQIVGNGQPIILLADCQTTGGYAKIATVISADLPILAQLRPDQSIRFEAVSIEDAEALRITMLEGLSNLRANLRTGGSQKDETEHLLNINLIDGVVGGVY
ncbi:MAG: biotin-dependent carboxyltransferase family protein [Rhodospirillales bacterium]|nr:biotin-dependent carboxyltransferase family protein [Rhodospirillales bacterium]